MTVHLLAINPGSTSTKLAWYDGDALRFETTVRHDDGALRDFARVADQYDFRLATVTAELARQGCDLNELDAVVGRGGIFDPIEGGTYRVTAQLADRLAEGRPWDHASNLGGRLAYGLMEPLGKPAFIVDPVSVDELDDEARVTGLPEVKRVSLVHALNVKAMARRAAEELEKPLAECRFVVAHLGGGLTICSFKEGRITDFDSGNDGGPIAVERCGRLPAAVLLDLAFDGPGDLKTLKRRLAGNAGLKALCGTSDVRQIQSRAAEGDQGCALALDAFVYGVSCSVGMMAAALDGRVDALIFTGGIVHGADLMARILAKVDWIAPALRYPGEDELAALAGGALRVLRGLEEAKIYHRP